MIPIDVVYFNAGGGHRASALALQAAVARQGLPWRVRLVPLFEVLDPKHVYRRLTGFEPEDYYNWRLAKDLTFGLALELKLFQAMVRGFGPWIERQLEAHWSGSEPALVVSVIPNLNRPLCASLARARPGVPFVTLLTDLADFPPHFWIEPDQFQHFICGTSEAVRQARASGHSAARVHASSGLIIRPDFYTAHEGDRRAERVALGLDPDRPTAIVLFGGHGSKAMLTLARELRDTQLILCCGRNAALADALRGLAKAAPRCVVEFTPEIARYMRLADVFIGKPGPGCISEALHMGLPVLVLSNRRTMPQERFNPRWVEEQGVGVAVASIKAMPLAVADAFARLAPLRERVAAVRNRALYEVPEILASILSLSRAAEPAPVQVPRATVDVSPA